MSQKDYSASYTDEGFWNKITEMPGDAGCAILRTACTLFGECSKFCVTIQVINLLQQLAEVEASPENGPPKNCSSEGVGFRWSGSDHTPTIL